MYVELVEYMVKSLVDDPESVAVEETRETGQVLLELRVAEPDMGRVIGKSGRVINAVRSIVQIAAAKKGDRVSLELI
ncbi:MAG: KH domain-containing protein [Chloroflexi bacterium]|nr:KH domain-containing protein [Chloroflexota bacterium]MBP8055805.1 KH domain-containing protein [Chloroflexota bacterium]